MHIFKRFLPLVFLACVISDARADIRIFMQIPGITGNSTDPAHTGWFNLTAANHGFEITYLDDIRGGGGIPKFQDFAFFKPLDINTPALLLRNANGKSFPTVTVEYVTTDPPPQTFLKIVFTNVLMRSNSMHGSTTSANPIPIGQTNFSFDKIQWIYTVYNADGTVKEEIKVGYDLTTSTTF